MPWPSEWDDQREVLDDDEPRQVLELGPPTDVDRSPRWDVDEVGADYERGSGSGR